MNRRRMGVVAALLLLFAALLTTWVYLYDINIPLADWGWRHGGHRLHDQPDDKASADSDSAFETDDVADTNSSAGQRNRPLEMETEPRRVALPPERIEVPTPAVDTGGSKPQIEAELRAGEPGVANAADNFELDPYVVSTLMPAAVRPYIALGKSALMKTRDFNKYDLSNFKPEFDYVLQGEVNFPSLTDAETTRLADAYRLQAWVYTPEFPELACAVDPQQNRFALQLTDRQVKDYRNKGVKVCLHSPAFRVRGGGETITLTKTGEKLPQIELELAPVYKLVVRVTPQAAVDEGVRVWVERRGVDCELDDSLYMSANVPPSGELVFHVPEHYGELRIAATGEGWHSGLPQLVALSDWSKSGARVNLECAAEPCETISGVVGVRASVTVGDEDRMVFHQGGIARIEDTSFGAVVYSSDNGQFKMNFPFASLATQRQLIVTRAGCAPRVVPLDGTYGDESTAYITTYGRAPNGPWQISLDSKFHVALDIPELKKGKTQLYVSGERPGFHTNTDDVALPWGTHVLMVMSIDKFELICAYWASDEAWQAALSDQSTGTPKLKLIKLDDFIKDQGR